MILFHTWPVDGGRSLLILSGMTLSVISISLSGASRWLRHGVA
jgi:hypothetical protein